jgi:flagellar M-ring protein fliF
MNDYVMPFMPLVKYLFAAFLLYLFYKKVIVPFMAKMLEETKEEELPPQEDLEDLEIDAEDTLEKFKAAKKRVEEQLGLTEDFNEEELRYDILLEKLKAAVIERNEEVANLLQEMVRNDSDFNSRKEI